jgi:hypothetical protein
MCITRALRVRRLRGFGPWLAGACLAVLAACGGERAEPVATPPATPDLAAINAEGELVKLQVQAGAKPRSVAAGQSCGVAAEGSPQPVCQAGLHCFKAAGAAAGACVASPDAPRNEP